MILGSLHIIFSSTQDPTLPQLIVYLGERMMGVAGHGVLGEEGAEKVGGSLWRWPWMPDAEVESVHRGQWEISGYTDHQKSASYTRRRPAVPDIELHEALRVGTDFGLADTRSVRERGHLWHSGPALVAPQLCYFWRKALASCRDPCRDPRLQQQLSYDGREHPDLDGVTQTQTM